MGSQRVRQDWATKHSTETVNVSLSFVRTGHTKHFSGPVFLGSHQPSQSFWNHSCFIVIPFKWILWHYAWFNEDITTHFFLYIHISDKHYPVNSQCLVCVCVCVCVFGGERTRDVTNVRDEETMPWKVFSFSWWNISRDQDKSYNSLE